MRRILLIGIGTGDPAFVTMQAITALNEAAAFFAFDKGEEKSDLIAARKAICDRYISNSTYQFITLPDPVRNAADGYKAGVDAWHDERAQLLAKAIETAVPEGGCGALLVWGEPGLYDSTLRVVRKAVAELTGGAEIEIIPGISAVQILTACHKIGLNEIGEPVIITTGRKLHALGPIAPGTSVVVMLDGALACRERMGEGLTIYWGAALGSPDQVLASGPLDTVIEEITAKRASLKQDRGWVMDTYLLRKA